MPIIVQVLVVAILQVLARFSIKKLQSAKDGIPKEVALEIIKSVAESEANPTTQDVFSDAIALLK